MSIYDESMQSWHEEDAEEELRGPLYPDVEVQLSGEDGNGFAIVGRVSAALRRAGVGRDRIAEYQSEATSDDHDHLIQTTMKWVDVS